MSRVLKFRAWYQGKMYPVQRLEVVQTFANYTEAMDVVTLVDVATGASKVVAAHQVEIMQFTGLLDKNGKEVYEGDIVKTAIRPAYVLPNGGNPQMCVVEYDENAQLLPFHYVSGYDGELWMDVIMDGFEVIGNLYETPEILKEQP